MAQISRIYSEGPAPEIPEETARDVDHSNRARLWHETGVAIVDPDRLHSWVDREYVIGVAEKLYGKRKVK